MVLELKIIMLTMEFSEVHDGGVNHCKNMHQVLTFAWVNAHNQNGQVERRIRSLHDLARCPMIH